MLARLFLIISMMLYASSSLSQEVVRASIPDAQIVGKGRLSVAFWDVYDATLYAPSGQWNQSQPYALSIHYLRQIDGQDIAERSVEEIRNQGYSNEQKLKEWNSLMETIFPNVEDGTVLTAVFIPGRETTFYQGNEKIGVIADAEFTLWFANIWLGEETSEPSLRRQLMGRS